VFVLGGTITIAGVIIAQLKERASREQTRQARV
jgi:hypothetical protein